MDATAVMIILSFNIHYIMCILAKGFAAPEYLAKGFAALKGSKKPNVSHGVQGEHVQWDKPNWSNDVLRFTF